VTTVATTRERLVATGVKLFQRQGLAGTGIKQILSDADARFSSLYHYFPGGKDELAAEVIRTAGSGYQELVELVWDQAEDPVAAMRAIFQGAAATLEASSYADACPIATVALEVASTNEPLRAATAEVFKSWLDAARLRLTAAGISEADARRLAVSIITLLEGAFLLCRAAKNTEAMLRAGESAAMLVASALPSRRRSAGTAGAADGGQDPVQAEVPGLVDVAAEPERSRELHRDESVRPGHDRAPGRQRVLPAD
jgi:AcrR family transcriptional regulator